MRTGTRRGWGLFAVLLGLGLLLGSSLAPAAAERAKHESAEPAFTVPNPGADLWRGVRRSVAGQSQVKGLETGVLINAAGEKWRNVRNRQVIRYSGWALFIVVLLILFYHVFHGPVKIAGGRSGIPVPRWTLFERVLHWITATLFVILAITGLSLLFGRAILLPILGPDAFRAWALLGKFLHEYLGPFFVVAIVLTLIVYFTRCLPAWTDVAWTLKGGGLFGDQHPHADDINAGEKGLYWIMLTFGLAVSVSGLALDAASFRLDPGFPGYAPTRENLQLANIIHGAAAVVWLWFMLGHIYLGTVGVEGALEGMWYGHVDANWAKQHHDLWYERVKDRPASPQASPGAPQTEAGD